MTRIQWAYGLVLAGLTAVLAFGDKIDALRRSKAWMYIYVIVDMFKIELVVVFVVLLCWDWVQRKSLWEAGVKAMRTSNLIVRSLAIGVSFLLVLAIAYEARLYILGKRINLRGYPERLIVRAERALADGEAWQAEIHLRVCAEIFSGTRCDELLRQLGTRLERARFLRSLYGSLATGVTIPSRALEIVYLLDRNEQFYQQQRERIQAENEQVAKEYREALILLTEGNRGRAVDKLQKLQSQRPGVGDTHILLDEIKLIGGDQGNLDQARTPYLAALKKHGVDAFVHQTLHVEKPRSLEEVRKNPDANRE